MNPLRGAARSDCFAYDAGQRFISLLAARLPMAYNPGRRFSGFCTHHSQTDLLLLLNRVINRR
jgi:hypothetical protein